MTSQTSWTSWKDVFEMSAEATDLMAATDRRDFWRSESLRCGLESVWKKVMGKSVRIVDSIEEDVLEEVPHPSSHARGRCLRESKASSLSPPLMAFYSLPLDLKRMLDNFIFCLFL
jgi:hypothetical protein